MLKKDRDTDRLVRLVFTWCETSEGRDDSEETRGLSGYDRLFHIRIGWPPTGRLVTVSVHDVFCLQVPR